MSRLSLFSSPLLLGFDHVERALDRVARNSDGYPPYNIEQIGEEGLRITLAVAGFAIGDLSIQVEDSQLSIRGKQADDQERVYIHRGIAGRQFQRSFVLAEGIRVVGAYLDRGLLHIDVIRETLPCEVRTVPITAAAGQMADRPTADSETADSQAPDSQVADREAAVSRLPMHEVPRRERRSDRGGRDTLTLEASALHPAAGEVGTPGAAPLKSVRGGQE